jgi:predicted SAM-dependent methyltransferase
MNIKYTKLDIGCGANKCDSEAVGIDVAAGPGVDIVGDALDVLRGIDTNSVGSVYSSHFLEHHEHPDKILQEMIRVIVPTGRLELRVPHFSDPWFYSDPTHKHPFGLYTFAYYFKNSFFLRKVPTYCNIDGAQIETIRLVFSSTRPFYLRHAFKKVIQYLVNSSNYTRELYEELFSGILSCSEIHVIIRKI